MSELDVLKEKVAYLKVLFGILVVTAISLVGWLAANFIAPLLLYVEPSSRAPRSSNHGMTSVSLIEYG